MLRAADINDLERLSELFRELHAYHVEMKPEKFRMPDDGGFFRETMTGFLNSDEWITLVHADDGSGELDGYVIFKAFNSEMPDEQPQRICHITHFMVAENSRRHGIGTEIMNKVFELARSVQCDCVRLSVNALNNGAIAFDERMGFERAAIAMMKKL